MTTQRSNPAGTDEQLNTPWRLVATSVYAPPADGRVLVTLELDVSSALAEIARRRECGRHITITHLFSAALARALAFDVPEVNCAIRRGRIVRREHVDIMLAAHLPDTDDMVSLRLRDVHSLSVGELADEIQRLSASARAGDEGRLMRAKHVFSRVPWPFRSAGVAVLKLLVHTLGIHAPRIGLTSELFGAVGLSNIGTFGLSHAMAALFPLTQLSAVLVMGAIELKPVVRDGEIVTRSMMPVSITFDHRLLDGSHVGRMAKAIGRYLEHAAELP